MVASQIRASLISGLLVLGFASAAIPSLNHDQPKDNSVNEAPWIPATQPRDFSYSIQDGIQGASQIRQETWKNNSMNGLYAFPLGDGLWQMVTYIADDKGYRILSSKQVTEAEMLKGAASAHTDTANVDINRDGDKTAYTVNADEIFNAAKKNQTDEEARKHRRGLGLYEAHQNASEAAFEARSAAGPVPAHLNATNEAELESRDAAGSATCAPEKADEAEVESRDAAGVVGPSHQLNASEAALESRGSGPVPVSAQVNASQVASKSSRSAGPMPANLNASSVGPMASGDWPAGHMARSTVMPVNASATMASGDWPVGPMTRSAAMASNGSADMASGDWPAGHMARSSSAMPLNASATMASGDWPVGPMTRSADMASNGSGDMAAGDWPVDMDSSSKTVRESEDQSSDKDSEELPSY